MWYSVYKVDTGKLLSIASVIPPDEELQAKGVWYITTEKRPDTTKVIWDPGTLSWIPKPADPDPPPDPLFVAEAKRLWGLTDFTQADGLRAIQLIFRIMIARLIIDDNPDAWKG